MCFRAGMMPDEFWCLTPGETLIWLEAAQEHRADEIRASAWLIGSYTAIAYHDPKKYPRSPKHGGRTTPQTAEQMIAKMNGLAQRQ